DPQEDIYGLSACCRILARHLQPLCHIYPFFLLFYCSFRESQSQVGFGAGGIEYHTKVIGLICSFIVQKICWFLLTYFA
ncbi:hypothetical protein Ddye_015648, partial [Dipteronia dyeriana]